MTVPTTPIHGFKLGKLEAHRPNLRDFKDYFTAPLPPPPPQAHYGGKVVAPWAMDGNGPDPSVTLPGVPANWGGCGDCVAVGLRNFVALGDYSEGAHGPQDAIPSPNDVVSTYCSLRGVSPEQLFTDPDQYDGGMDIATVLQTWLYSPIYGVRVGGYAPVDYSDLDNVRNALFLCGGVPVGIQLPASAEAQFPGTWTYQPGSEILGGHCIVLTGYDTPTAMFWGVTWGKVIGISEGFLAAYLDEAYACVSAQAIQKGTGPTGLNVSLLQSDILALNAVSPVEPPEPSPVVTPPPTPPSPPEPVPSPSAGILRQVIEDIEKAFDDILNKLEELA